MSQTQGMAGKAFVSRGGGVLILADRTLWTLASKAHCFLLISLFSYDKNFDSIKLGQGEKKRVVSLSTPSWGISGTGAQKLCFPFGFCL